MRGMLSQILHRVKSVYHLDANVKDLLHFPPSTVEYSSLIPPTVGQFAMCVRGGKWGLSEAAVTLMRSPHSPWKYASAVVVDVHSTLCRITTGAKRNDERAGVFPP